MRHLLPFTQLYVPDVYPDIYHVLLVKRCCHVVYLATLSL